jgi:hypothetical protein
MSNVSYLRLSANQSPPSLVKTPFKAVVVIEQAVSDAWRAQVSDWLVRSGCLYMVAWGDQCSAWDDSVDVANLSAFDWGDIPDDDFVMTTWHEREALAEAFWFAKNAAFHPTVDLDRTMIVHVTQHDRGTELLNLYRAAQNEE